MTKQIVSISNTVFSIAITIALIGGGLVGLLFLLALLLGGHTGETLAVFARQDLLPLFIRTAAISMVAGLIRFYADNYHPLSLRTEKKE